MTIDLELTEESIESAIQLVEQYGKDISTRTELIVEELAKEVKKNAEDQLMNHIETGETFDSLKINKTGKYTQIVTVGGAAVWLEFGTGVVANHAVPGEYLHPKAAELGMSGLGTYGKGHGANPWGWWYYDENGRKRHTYGIPATMFMYYSAMATRSKMESIAREVFQL